VQYQFPAAFFDDSRALWIRISVESAADLRSAVAGAALRLVPVLVRNAQLCYKPAEVLALLTRFDEKRIGDRITLKIGDRGRRTDELSGKPVQSVLCAADFEQECFLVSPKREQVGQPPPQLLARRLQISRRRRSGDIEVVSGRRKSPRIVLLASHAISFQLQNVPRAPAHVRA
jgi:hypothetical protein